MATKESELRKRYGVSKEPIEATKVYKKTMDHLTNKSIDASAWLIFNENTGQRYSVNVYNGGAGKNAKFSPLPTPTGKDFDKLVKGYEEAPVEDCPVAKKVKVDKSKATETATA